MAYTEVEIEYGDDRVVIVTANLGRIAIGAEPPNGFGHAKIGIQAPREIQVERMEIKHRYPRRTPAC